MDKRAFVKQVRNWEWRAVEQALAREPELAKYVDRIGKTPLHHCAGVLLSEAALAVSDSIKTARALVSAGADVNAIRIIMDDGAKFHATPLWYAVAWGRNVDLARFLLEAGAHPDNNAMRSAIWEQDRELCEMLRSFGGEVDPVVGQETPLLQIAKAKRFKLLNWLVAHGANINFQDARGCTALHYAIRRNHNLAQIEELLRHGADPTVKAKDGTTPITLARRLGKTRLVALLEE